MTLCTRNCGLHLFRLQNLQQNYKFNHWILIELFLVNNISISSYCLLCKHLNSFKAKSLRLLLVCYFFLGSFGECVLLNRVNFTSIFLYSKYFAIFFIPTFRPSNWPNVEEEFCINVSIQFFFSHTIFDPGLE